MDSSLTKDAEIVRGVRNESEDFSLLRKSQKLLILL